MLSHMDNWKKVDMQEEEKDRMALLKDWFLSETRTLIHLIYVRMKIRKYNPGGKDQST